MTDIRQELLALQAQVVALTRSVYVADTQAIAARKSAEAAEAERDAARATNVELSRTITDLTERLNAEADLTERLEAERDALAAESVVLREALKWRTVIL